jgi:lactose/L-arabinose transport system permease protein
VTSKVTNALAYVFLTIAAVLSVFPLVWMIIASTNRSVDVIAGKLTFGGNLAVNYSNLISAQDVWKFFMNSGKYAILTTVLSLLVCSMAGYAFEIFHDKYKDMLFVLILMTMMLPFVALMVPLFQMFSSAKLLNTSLGFLLPSISTPFLIMMFRQSAKSFPVDIIEAARIDGLNEWQIFFRMFVPTMRSTYAAATTITFMNAWNNYLWPKVIMTKSNSQTMPMMISSLTSGYHTDYGMLMLAVLITTLPTAIVFFILQKSFAEGITGAVK